MDYDNTGTYTHKLLEMVTVFITIALIVVILRT